MDRRFQAAILLTALLHFLALLLRGTVAIADPVAVALKPLPILVGAAGVWLALREERAKGDRRSVAIVVGLLTSALGDVLIEIEQKLFGVASGFLLGMAAFAIAHVAFLASFRHPERRFRPGALALVLLWTSAICWFVWDTPAFARLHAPLV